MEQPIINSLQNLKSMDRVHLARDKARPNIHDYINNIFDDFIELHGDRAFSDDSSIVGGVAMLENTPVTVIGHKKGKSLEENLECNFGMANPSGFRKALRLMKQAEKFSRPIITFIDTAGAYPGMLAEELGQGEAIARNLMEMSALKTPVISIITGEGGSGGALALCVANKIYMLENAVFSILSPEGFATILWKDASKASQAAELMKLTASDLKELGIIDSIVKEELPIEENTEKLFSIIKENLVADLAKFKKMSASTLASERYKKFRVIGDCTGL